METALEMPQFRSYKIGNKQVYLSKGVATENGRPKTNITLTPQAFRVYIKLQNRD